MEARRVGVHPLARPAPRTAIYSPPPFPPPRLSPTGHARERAAAVRRRPLGRRRRRRRRRGGRHVPARGPLQRRAHAHRGRPHDGCGGAPLGRSVTGVCGFLAAPRPAPRAPHPPLQSAPTPLPPAPPNPSHSLRTPNPAGKLSDTRQRFLGTRAPRLFPVSVRGARSMLALSSRPWLGYSDMGRYSIMPLSYEALDYAAVRRGRCLICSWIFLW